MAAQGVALATRLRGSVPVGSLTPTTFLRGLARLGGRSLPAGPHSPSLLATMLSLAAVGRPDFLATADLGCAVLSFLSNICYLNTQDVQLAMPFAFLPWGPLSCPRGLAW